MSTWGPPGGRAVVVEFAEADVPVEAEVRVEQDDEVQLLALRSHFGS